ncbi:MAG: putative metal-binding motif-containing protein, partial [Myxococcota bacterium]|nr:putative metal-binding motif-containing protein [Myxococcota bacterium]
MRKKLLLVRKRGSVIGWAVLLVGTLVGGRAAAVGQPAAASHAELDVDDDGDGFPAGEDCDDNDPAVHPDAAEICDAIDNDCDETTAVDQGTPCYDEDEDGYSPLDGDCDDQDPSCHPGAVEIVGDMMDNDCDRLVDESPSVDRDGDGYSADQGDCDDGDPTVHPAAAEEPLDRRDNDCDGEVDEPLPVGAACATHRGGQRPGPATLSWAVLVALLVRRRFAVRGRSGRRRWRSGGKMTRTVARILGLSMFCLLWGCPVDDDDAADDDATGDDDVSGDDDDTGDDDTGDDDTTGDDDATDSCGFADAPTATVTILERYTSLWDGQVSARVQDAPYPEFHVVQLEEGPCRYLTFELGNCDPPCDFSQVCISTDECVDYPVGISAGVLTVTGLGDPIMMETDDWNPGYYWGPWDLPEDIFDEGDPIEAAFDGADFPATTLSARGVAAVEPEPLADPVLIEDGADTVLTWTAGGDPDACVQVR